MEDFSFAVPSKREEIREGNCQVSSDPRPTLAHTSPVPCPRLRPVQCASLIVLLAYRAKYGIKAK